MGLRNTVKSAERAAAIASCSRHFTGRTPGGGHCYEASTVGIFLSGPNCCIFPEASQINPKWKRSPTRRSFFPDPWHSNNAQPTVVTGTVTETETPALTPPATGGPANNPSTGQGQRFGGSQARPTLFPVVAVTSNGDNGNHYGQTPIPESTKGSGR